MSGNWWYKLPFLNDETSLKITGLVGALRVGFLPGGMIFQSLNMATDIIDPYGYNTALTRAALSKNITQLHQTWQDLPVRQSLIQKQFQTLLNHMDAKEVAKLTQEQKNNIQRVIGLPVSEYYWLPEPQPDCFPTNPVTGAQMEPTAACDATYRQYFREAKSERGSNEVKVVENEQDTVNALLKLQTFTRAQKEQQMYLLVVYIITGTIGVAILAMVLWKILRWVDNKG